MGIRNPQEENWDESMNRYLVEFDGRPITYQPLAPTYRINVCVLNRTMNEEEILAKLHTRFERISRLVITSEPHADCKRLDFLQSQKETLIQ